MMGIHRGRVPNWIAVVAIPVALAVALGVPDIARAGTVAVSEQAAKTGSKGLRVMVESSCTSQNQALDNQTLMGPASYEACDTVSSSDTTVSSGSVTFRAGRQVVLGNEFSVASGASFVAATDSSLLPDAYLTDTTPSAEKHYAAAFYIKADALSMTEGDRFDLLSGLSNSGIEWFSLTMGDYPLLGEKRLILRARLDGGSIVTTDGTTEVVLPSGWHWVQVEWKAETAGSGSYIRLYVDDYQQAGLGPFDNDNARIDTIRFGASEVPVGTSGSIDFDRFISRIAGVIWEP